MVFSPGIPLPSFQSWRWKIWTELIKMKWQRFPYLLYTRPAIQNTLHWLVKHSTIQNQINQLFSRQTILHLPIVVQFCATTTIFQNGCRFEKTDEGCKKLHACSSCGVKGFLNKHSALECKKWHGSNTVTTMPEESSSVNVAASDSVYSAHSEFPQSVLNETSVNDDSNVKCLSTVYEFSSDITNVVLETDVCSVWVSSVAYNNVSESAQTCVLDTQPSGLQCQKCCT